MNAEERKINRFVREFVDLLRRTLRTREIADACAAAFDWSPGVEEGDPCGMVGIVVDFVRYHPTDSRPPPARARLPTQRLEEVVLRRFGTRCGKDLLLEAIWEEEDEGHPDGADAMIRCMWGMQAEDVIRMFHGINRRGDFHRDVDGILGRVLASAEELRLRAAARTMRTAGTTGRPRAKHGRCKR